VPAAAATCELGAEAAAPAGDREVPPAGVPDGTPPTPATVPGGRAAPQPPYGRMLPDCPGRSQAAPNRAISALGKVAGKLSGVVFDDAAGRPRLRVLGSPLAGQGVVRWWCRRQVNPPGGRAGHCLGICLPGSMNGLGTVTPRWRPVGVSTWNSWPSGSARAMGSMA
jgi:hypothetical protein